MTRNPSELVIFDCDGVLVDSEPISIEVLRAVITEVGGDIAEATAYERFLGRSMATIIGMLRDEFGLVFSDTHLDRMRGLVYERFRNELKPIAGIAETLGQIPGKRAVASSSQLERIRLSLEVTGLLPLLEPHIYSASMVKRGKPAPDLFLHVARGMGVAPQNCTVIEDSPAGIQAAKDAGMRVFAFAGGSHAGQAGLVEAFRALQPDVIFEDMRDLPGLLGAGSTLPLEGRVAAQRPGGVASATLQRQSVLWLSVSDLERHARAVAFRRRQTVLESRPASGCVVSRLHQGRHPARPRPDGLWA